MSEELALLHRRIAELSEALEDIAYIADGHRLSTARDGEGNNIALSAILGRAAVCIGLDDRLRLTGSVFSPSGTVVE